MDRRSFLFQVGLAGASLGAAPLALAARSTDETPRGGRRPATGPLRVHPRNPRYFTDGSGRAIYLTGSHTWGNLVDIGPSDPPLRFDFAAYLDFLQRYGHNFIRLWTWESVTWNTKEHGRDQLHHVGPQPWARTGPGLALDGKPKYNLKKFDPEYFRRLRSRVKVAGDRGIYVSIMLFEGWAMQHAPGAYEGHPFHPANNVNGIAGDANGDGKGLEIHTMSVRAVTTLQEAYVRKVVDTMNGLDNVLYEISNENHPPSTEWQYHLINFIHAYEKTRRKQHPVGMTFQATGGQNKALFDSPADWISPNPDGGYRNDPPPNEGRKVILNDTDHLWGIGGNQAWVWKSFTRGHHPLFMDPYDGVVLGERFGSRWEPVRRSLGYTRRFAETMKLTAMEPRPELASTGYCLAQPTGPHAEFLMYLPKAGAAKVDLTRATGWLGVTWFDPASGESADRAAVPGGAWREFSSPFKEDAVLHLVARR